MPRRKLASSRRVMRKDAGKFKQEQTILDREAEIIRYSDREHNCKYSTKPDVSHEQLHMLLQYLHRPFDLGK
jgi:hypothetical protein